MNRINIYIASPYTYYGDPMLKGEVEMDRVIKNRVAWCKLTELGFNVYSPVVVADAIRKSVLAPTDWSVWRRIDFSFIEWCHQLWVLTLEDWGRSIGIPEEVRCAETLGKTIRYVEDDDFYPLGLAVIRGEI